MSNFDRKPAGLNPGDNEVGLCAQVANQLFHELNRKKTPDPDQQDISDLLGALAALEGFTLRRLGKTVDLDHDDGEHGVNNHRRLVALRARVNRRLELLASERG